ncbi:MAG: formylglycine-generating enzyme family protein [Hyphomicrobiaceae bacterium]|nr:formylglycine-generating enzyme family protein [Hyphomicrobiaceae bacterium]
MTRTGLAAAVATVLACGAAAAAEAPSDRVSLGSFAIDRTEVTIGRFRAFVAARNLVTAAEKEGGGFEYGAGWERRPGWTWDRPYGAPGADDEPVVHVSWSEARDFCSFAGGRLPTREEWTRAAYTETRSAPSDGLETGRTYLYPVGNSPEGMNTSRRRHVAVGTTKAGVNGLFDMGANVWEWLADRRGDSALTAGGSWWYGPETTRAEAAQWKPAAFYVVYIGLRCAYDVR